MIHVFNCLGEACKAPHKICEKCAEACHNSPFAACCKQVSETFNEILNRPLGGFVLMAVWVGILEMALVAYAIFNQDVLHSCVFPDPMFGFLDVKKWLSVQLGFAALNIVFAPYLQQQVWRRLIEEAKERDNPEAPASMRTQLANTDHGAIQASKQDVAQAFKSVFMYDIGTCIYFFILIASFYNCWWGSGQILSDRDDCDIAADGFPRYSSWAGMFYVVFVFFYGAAWLLNMYCMERGDTLTLRSGLTAAAGLAAATGKPIPGLSAAATLAGGGAGGGAGGKYHSPQESAKRTDNASGGGLFGAFTNSGAGGGKETRTAQSNAMAEQPVTNQAPPEKPSCGKSFMKLIASLGLDMLGNATYFAPGVGEMGDAVFAPASAVMLRMMYNANGVAALGLVEELLPLTDIIPTATIAWFLETCAPNSPVTKALGISKEWRMTGEPQK